MKLKYRKKIHKNREEFQKGRGKNFSGWPEYIVYTPVYLSTKAIHLYYSYLSLLKLSICIIENRYLSLLKLSYLYLLQLFIISISNISIYLYYSFQLCAMCMHCVFKFCNSIHFFLYQLSCFPLVSQLIFIELALLFQTCCKRSLNIQVQLMNYIRGPCDMLPSKFVYTIPLLLQLNQVGHRGDFPQSESTF